MHSYCAFTAFETYPLKFQEFILKSHNRIYPHCSNPLYDLNNISRTNDLFSGNVQCKYLKFISILK